MRAIVAATLKLYDAASNLVIIVNARPEEQAGLSQELTRLGVRSPGLQALDSSLNENKRKAIYARGGLISVTTRILIVDMLKKTIPLELVSGLVILHAEDVTPLSNEAFAVRMYREANRDGFLKAFSDNADSFAMGLNPLQTVMGQLRIRKVELWPRFHKSIIRDLGERKADVVELHQPLSRSMRNIQNALVECLDATLNELRRSASGVEVDDYSLENAIFKAFDVIVRRQLAKKWHLLSPKTRQLVDDLKTLRELLDYLISYDCVSFVQYLDFLLTSQTTSSSGKTRQNQSPWLFMDAANIVFAEAKARVMVGAVSKEAPTTAAKVDAPIEVNDSDEEEAAYGQLSRPSRSSTKRPWWLPAGIEPTLEEPPKWQLLREVLDEIEQDIHWTEDKDPSLITPNNTILIMTSTSKSCESVQRYLSEMTDSIIGAPDDVVDEEGHTDPSSTPGRTTMMTSLKRYLYDKMSLANMTATMKGTSAAAAEGGEGNQQSPQKASTSSTSQPYESEALKRKQVWERGAAPPTKRRRQRGGANMSVGQRGDGTSLASEQLEKEAAELSEFMDRAQALADEGGDGEDEEVGDASIDQDDSLDGSDDEGFVVTGENIPDVLNTDDFDEHFGVLDMDSLIVVRHYNGDGDDYILQELRPRFVILFDPDPAFVRRIELFRATTPGVNPRVYFLLYAESVEEQRYLSSLRREKESFEKLIREKSMMALPLQADGLPAAQDADERLLRTINSRIAGGQRGVTNEKPRIIVDMREFQSSLPSLLSAAGMEVHPHTLPVADYVISPEQAVERKSLSDLISSFNSGRLFSQVCFKGGIEMTVDRKADIVCFSHSADGAPLSTLRPSNLINRIWRGPILLIDESEGLQVESKASD